jgi:hypothetical protein
LVSDPNHFKSSEKFVVLLWLHESERVYGDRLVSPEDLAKYNGLAQGAGARRVFFLLSFPVRRTAFDGPRSRGEGQRSMDLDHEAKARDSTIDRATAPSSSDRQHHRLMMLILDVGVLDYVGGRWWRYKYKEGEGIKSLMGVVLGGLESSYMRGLKR